MSNVFGGFTLSSSSSVAVMAIDSEILESISRMGELRTLQDAALSAAVGNDRFFRTVLIVGSARGVFHLPASEQGKYPAKHESITAMLSAVSSESTNSQRKYTGEVLRSAWNAQQLGFDPLDADSVSALRKMAAKPKEVKTSLDQDSVSQSAREAEQAEREREQAKKEEAELLESTIQERIQSALEIEREGFDRESANKLTEVENQLKKIQADLICALYGTQKERQVLKEYYPKLG